MTASPLLDIKDLEAGRGEAENGFHLIVDHFRLAPGEAVVVTGPSGCGKSTFLDVLGLVLQPLRQDHFHLLDGIDAGGLWQRGQDGALARLRATAIGHVLQTGGLFPFMDVRRNIRIGLDLLGRDDSSFLAHLVDRLGLAGALDKMPAALSVGERQRAAIARALAHRPRLVLADEPTAALDPANGERVMELLLGLVREMGSGLILVSHDPHIAQRHGLATVTAQIMTGADRPSCVFSHEAAGSA